jgi:hypothetical protein
MTYNADNGEIYQNGDSTFFMGGTQFRVVCVRLSARKQDGLSNFASTTILCELHIWGKPTMSTIPKADAAVLIIPIVQRPLSTNAGDGIIKALSRTSVSLVELIPHGPGTDVAQYTTCVETNSNSKGTMGIAVAYWTNGLAVTQDQIKKHANFMKENKDFVPFGIPDVFGYRVMTTFTLLNNIEQTKANRTYDIVKSLLQPYSTTVALDVATIEFKNGFRLIVDFDFKKETDRSMNSYKCIAIDRSRDIVNGQLILDPATGRYFSEEEKQARQHESIEVYPIDLEARKNLWITFLVIIGIIVGISLLAGVVSIIAAVFFNRKAQGLSAKPIISGVNCAAAAAEASAATGVAGAAGVAAATATTAATTAATAAGEAVKAAK